MQLQMCYGIKGALRRFEEMETQSLIVYCIPLHN